MYHTKQTEIDEKKTSYLSGHHSMLFGHTWFINTASGDCKKNVSKSRRLTGRTAREPFPAGSVAAGRQNTRARYNNNNTNKYVK